RAAFLGDAGFVALDPLHPAAVLHSRHSTRSEIWPVISSDGRWIFTAEPGKQVQIWNARNGTLLTNLNTGGYKIKSAQFSPDNRWLIIGVSTGYRFWEVGSWKPGVTIPLSITDTTSRCIAFSSD